MLKTKRIHPQYITNEKGTATAVILPLRKFNEIMEDLHDLALVAERRKESTIPHAELKAELKRAKIL